MKFIITIFKDEDGIYIAECPSIPGCVSQGKTEKEAEKNIQDAIKECLEARAEIMEKINQNMIAYCGMNCSLCVRNQTPWKKDVSLPSCLGCREQNKSCAFIKKKCKNITKYKKGELNFCYECDIFPCEALSKLDLGYVKRYDFSMVANQKEIKETGLDKFIENQQEKYSCPTCGSIICIHEKKCLKCALKIL